MGANTTPVTDGNFETDVLKASGPVLVDFWAEWCGPCKMIGPILEELAGELQGQVKIVKMDLEESQLTPTKYGVRSIPTLILFKNGQPVATKVGAMPKPALQAWLKEQI